MRNCLARRGFRGAARCLAAVLAAVLAAGGAMAQEEADEPRDELPAHLKEMARSYASVEEWRGIWEAVEDSSHAGDGSGARVLTGNMEWTSHGKFTLRRDPGNTEPARGIFSWKGDGMVAGNKVTHLARWEYDGSGSETTARSAAQAPRKEAGFYLLLDPGEATITVGETEENMAEFVRGVTVVRESRRGRNELRPVPINRSTPNVQPYLSPLRLNYLKGDSKFSRAPGVLSFSDGDTRPGKTGGTTTNWSYRSQLVLFPVYDNLEVEVTIEGYAQWRPEGSIAKPGDAGNTLAARAVLRHKDGQPGADLPPVRQFRFELVGTSREPGVCLNWPLGAKDDDFDLRLARGPTGGDLSGKDQKLAVRNPPRDERQQPYADVTIESLDFGGRSELRVICELEDGREIIGLLKDGAGGQDLVRLPRMSRPGDWVAAAWREHHRVPDLPASHDEEEVKGQDYKGDGFTLYEEYRGFVENGRHVTGDPGKKDFFILNLGAPATREGIELFGRLAQLAVHPRLRDGAEMTQRDRLMNGNHREAPHRVAQHGVVLSHVGRGKGGGTIGLEGADGGKAFRPRDVNWVFVEAPDAPMGAFAPDNLRQHDLDPADRQRLYASAVAHELLHAVGVEHHGDEPMRVQWAYFQGPDHPLNPTGRMRFTESWSRGPGEFRADAKQTLAGADRGNTLTLLWEDTGEDMLNERAAAFAAALAAERSRLAGGTYVAETAASLASLGRGEDFWREYLAHDGAEAPFNFRMFVGRNNGPDSGSETCVMRYYFATAYEAAGKENTFYIIRPGTKQVGQDICTSPAGTGGNAESHPPQSRFGAARAGRGNCFAQICPNDAIPPPAAK